MLLNILHYIYYHPNPIELEDEILSNIEYKCVLKRLPKI